MSPFEDLPISHIAFLNEVVKKAMLTVNEWSVDCESIYLIEIEWTYLRLSKCIELIDTIYKNCWSIRVNTRYNGIYMIVYSIPQSG